LAFIVEHRAWQDPVTCQSHHAEASQLLKKGSAPSTIGKSDNSDNINSARADGWLEDAQGAGGGTVGSRK
jgi:hypothetical protein